MSDLLKRSAIIAFVLWHMFSISVYALPRTADDPLNVWIRNQLLPMVRPYVLITSQWQQWNLFSPDPLRRVSAYDIQQSDQDQWMTLETLDWNTISMWRRAPILKMLRRLEENDSDVALRNRLLEIECRERSLSRGTSLRLQRRYFVIPKHDAPIPLRWWQSYFPTEHRDVLASITCT